MYAPLHINIRPLLSNWDSYMCSHNLVFITAGVPRMLTFNLNNTHIMSYYSNIYMHLYVFMSIVSILY